MYFFISATTKWDATGRVPSPLALPSRPFDKRQWYEARRQQFLYHSTRLSTDKSDRRNRPNIKNSTRWQNVAISMAKSRLLFHSYRRLS